MSLPDKANFRTAQGRYLTRALFKETIQAQAKANGLKPYFSMVQEEDQPDVLSMKKLYLEIADPTEYEFATTVLGSYRHWQILCQCNWFQETLEEWRSELATLLQSRALKNIKRISDTDTPGALPANRFIAEKGWQEKKTKRGRPSKDEMEGYKKRLAEQEEDYADDAARLGFTVGSS